MATFGKLEPFAPYTDNWVEYEERMDQFFLANEINDGGKKRAVFLSSCGSKTYSLLRNLLAPQKPSDKTFAELKATLKAHLRPKPLVIAERFKFHCHKQKEEENATIYLAELRKLSEDCAFEGFLEDALRDRFVCGLRSAVIQRKLLSEQDLTLNKAIDIAVSMEIADQEASKITESVQREIAKTHRVAVQCFRCGKSNHDQQKCYYKNAKCHFCKGQGHLSKMCLKKKKPESQSDNPKKSTRPQQDKKSKKKSKIHLVNDDSSSEVNNEEEWPVFTIKTHGNSELYISLLINGKPCKMELDTGASVTIVSEKVFLSTFDNVDLKPTPILLKTYTGDKVKVLGETKVHVTYGDQEKVLPLIVVSGDGPSLFGRNWLTELKLDWNNIHLTKGSMSTEQLISKYRSVFDNSFEAMKGIEVNLNVSTDSKPKFFKPRPVPYALKDKIKTELDRLVENGVLEKVDSSNWATPIVPVMKPDNTVRICGDFKITVNPCLEVSEYPLPTAEDVFLKLNGGQKFTKLDMRHAYQQMRLNDQSREYVTINTHLGLYRYSRLPFGISSAPAIFQQTMDTVLEGLQSVGCILDDIIVTGQNDAEHLKNLELVLKRLADKNIKLKRDKCAFMQDEVEYFAFRVNKDGIQPSQRKVEAILQVPEPNSKKELQSWLGIVNYYRKFIPNLSTVVQPLTNLLKDNVQWNWTVKCHQACEEVKKLLSSSKLLVHYQPEKPLLLAVDASPYGVGAVISHVLDKVERPIAYASRTLTETERKYSQLEKEGLGIIFGIQKFHQYLYGRKFTLVTDSKPLSLILGPKKGIPILAASRIQRWAIQLSSYQFDIKYKNSAQNSNADTLSRFPLPESPEPSMFDGFMSEATSVNHLQLETLPITAKKVASETLKDNMLSKILSYTLNGWPEQKVLSEDLQRYIKFKDEFTVEEGCLLRGVRVVIPQSLTDTILDTLHVNHPGIVKMKSLARIHVWWLGIDQDIEKKVGLCSSCQIQQPVFPKFTVNPWKWPTKPWQRIHIDFAGPFMNQMFLIVVDAHSKWLEILRMSSTTAESTVNALRYLFSSHGLPEELVSDNGPQFVAEEFSDFLKANGVKHIRSAAYHPSSNGEAERCVRTFKTAMKTIQGGNLNQKLAVFLLSYRSTPHSTTKVTPAELFLGRRLRTRLDTLKPNLSSTIQKRATPKVSSCRSYEIGEPVYVQDYRKNQKWIKGVIIAKLGPVTYSVQVENDLIWKRHIDQIRWKSFDLDTDDPNQDTTECIIPEIVKNNIPLPLPGEMHASQSESSQKSVQSPSQLSHSKGQSDMPSLSTPSTTSDSSDTSIARRNPIRVTRGIPPKRLGFEN